MDRSNHGETYLRKRRRAFYFAFSGIGTALKHEPNMRIHFAAAFLSLAAGFYYRVSRFEWVAIVVCIAMVFMAELFNTCLEKLCDIVHPEIHPVVKRIKDMSAAGVLVTCIMAAVAGLIIFWPKLF